VAACIVGLSAVLVEDSDTEDATASASSDSN
jgi:hypothetical protein